VICNSVLDAWPIGPTIAYAAVATAQPAITSTAPEPAAAAPSAYLEGGAELGFAQGAIVFGETVEGGVQLDHGPLWAHAMVVTGSAGGVDEISSGSILQLRAGVEARSCVENRIACFVGGVDAAYSHTQYMGDNGDSDRAIGDLIIPRVGLDVGGNHLRFRPGIELGFDSKGIDQGAVSAAVAYQW
jgi:hypothetical protein